MKALVFASILITSFFAHKAISNGNGSAHSDYTKAQESGCNSDLYVWDSYRMFENAITVRSRHGDPVTRTAREMIRVGWHPCIVRSFLPTGIGMINSNYQAPKEAKELWAINLEIGKQDYYDELHPLETMVREEQRKYHEKVAARIEAERIQKEKDDAEADAKRVRELRVEQSIKKLGETWQSVKDGFLWAGEHIKSVADSTTETASEYKSKLNGLLETIKSNEAGERNQSLGHPP